MENINYYELLGLSPLDPWNDNAFKKALNAKQKLWSRESMSIGPEALIARQNLDLIPEIEHVLGDKRLREQHARVVHVSPGEMKQRRLMDFERQLAAKEAKGYLEESEIHELSQTFGDVVTEDEIITQINVPVRSVEDDVASEDVQPLDPAVVQDINEKLALIHVPDLYHLLQQSSSASSDELIRAAEQLFYEMTQREPKTAEVSVRMSLAGHAKNIFANQLRRQSYDAYLAQAAPTAPTTQKQNQATLDSNLPGQEPITSAPSSWGEDFSPPAPRVPAQEVMAQQLKLKNLGKALQLSWLWPTDCYEMLVSYSEHEWPHPEDGRSATVRVSRAYYEERGGHFDLYVAVSHHYYIVVTPLISEAGKLVPGKGAQIQGNLIPHAVIRYEIKNPRFGYKDRTLHLYIQPPAFIPPLLLVSKRNGHPLHKEDGTLVYREGNQQIHLQETIIKLQNDPFPSNTYVKLFLEDDDLYSVVTIYHPHEKKLRLG